MREAAEPFVGPGWVEAARRRILRELILHRPNRADAARGESVQRMVRLMICAPWEDGGCDWSDRIDMTEGDYTE